MIKLYEPKLYKEDIELVNKTLNEGWISGNSPIVEKFENKLKNFCQTKYCTVTSSGTTALHLSLLSSGIKKGDEVIIPSLTYIATANAVNYIGAKPVFCDVNLDDFQIDASKIEKNITKKTKAILPVHLYGGVPDLNQIKNIGNKHNLKVIHDAAEALGSEFNKKHSVSYKDVGILSFFPNKIITTGEGGAILTNNKKIYELSRKLRAQGLKKGTDYTHDIVGYNYRITAMSAALGLNQIDKIKRHRKLKTKIFNNYKNSLAKFGVNFQETKENVLHSYWLTVCIFNNNIDVSKLQKYLYKNKIETRRVFLPLPMQKPYLSNKKNTYRNALEIYQSGLCLPSYPGLEINDQDLIIEKIINFIK